MPTQNKIIFVVSGPSGAGKTEVITKAIANSRVVEKVITTTTRTPRENEKNHVDYHFVSKEKFEEKIKNKELLEWNLHHGNYYGTTIRSFQDVTQKGKNPVLILDPNGAEKIRKMFGKENTVLIFIKPENVEELKERMTKRDQKIDKIRYKESLEQLKREGDYDIVLVNRHGEADSCAKILSIILNYYT
jgi:guanylate kinase